MTRPGRGAQGARWNIGMAGAALAIAALATVPLLLRQMRAHTTEAALAQQLAQGRAHADSLLAALRDAPASAVSTQGAVSALYLERLRLGLGSPFRLIDQALRDPQLAAGRRRIALALLARTLDGQAYQIDPAALSLADRPGSDEAALIGRFHLALIDSVVSATRDPRVGELTVRLAYRLASASGAASRRAPELAINAASQVRDRVLAARDARALLEAAARMGGDPFVVLREWREGRRFLVERPVIMPLSPRAERAAVEALPTLVSRIEALAAGLQSTDAGDSVGGGRSLPEFPVSHATIASPLGAGLAQRMSQLAETRDLPPQAPVTVTLSGYAPLIRRTGAPSNERAWRARFVNHVRNEETLAAEFALLRTRLPEQSAVAGVAVLTAGVALRPYAQEKAWLPGDDAPTARDLQSRFGITVSYDPSVRSAWRPYLRRALASAVTDLRRVFASYDTRGLRVHFGESPLGERALALHDPGKRTIYFPPASSAGVMAHEFAHDLDWLAARRYYNGAGWYRTDRAVRQGSDQLSGALRQMASAAHLDSSSQRPGSATRPTEIFARNVDWFVSAALAREGRVNGYLTAVQDPLLTGYGSALTPEAAYDGGSATLRALSGITSIPEGVRRWFDGNFGTERKASVHEAVRHVLEVPVTRADLRAAPRFSLWAPDVISAALRDMPVTSAAWACLLPSFIERSVDAAAARHVVQLAAETRARGAIRQWSALAHRYPGMNAGPLRALHGPPWDPALVDALARDVRDAILWRALNRGADDVGAMLSGGTGLAGEPGCRAGR